MSKNEDIAKALQWANEYLLDKTFFCPAINEDVIFTEGGIKHAIKAKTYPLKIRLIYDAVEFLQKGELLFQEPDKKGRPDILCCYTLKIKKVYDNKERTIYIFLRKMRDGNVYYDHQAVT